MLLVCFLVSQFDLCNCAWFALLVSNEPFSLGRLSEKMCVFVCDCVVGFCVVLSCFGVCCCACYACVLAFLDLPCALFCILCAMM